MVEAHSIAAQFARLVEPDNGQVEELSGEEREYVEEYSQALDGLPEDAQALAFKNVIRGSGRCGFASGGRIDHLLNTDSRNRYRVTVRTNWRQGIESGQFDKVYISEAGGKKLLGCTKSGSIPVATYSRQVVGEVRI